VSISSALTTDKIRTTVYLPEQVFELMRVWRKKQNLGRGNNDSRAIADAASVLLRVGEARMEKLFRLAKARAASLEEEKPIELAIALLSKAIDDIEEESDRGS
jgi:hypothetical protein